jgi:hypothetical protein
MHSGVALRHGPSASAIRRAAHSVSADELTWKNAAATLCFRWARRQLIRGAFQQSRRQSDDPDVSGESPPPLVGPSRPHFAL